MFKSIRMWILASIWGVFSWAMWVGNCVTWETWLDSMRFAFVPMGGSQRHWFCYYVDIRHFIARHRRGEEEEARVLATVTACASLLSPGYILRDLQLPCDCSVGREI